MDPIELSATQKIAFRCNDFQENIVASFINLRCNKDLCDITLVSEDGQKLEAHKVVLSASSPVLKDLIQFNKDAQPLIILEDFNATDLNLILDFIYHGEADVCLEKLENFLAISEAFQLLKCLVVGTTEKESELDVAKTEVKLNQNNQGQKQIISGRKHHDEIPETVESPGRTFQVKGISEHEKEGNGQQHRMDTEETRMGASQSHLNAQIKKLSQNIEEAYNQLIAITRSESTQKVRIIPKGQKPILQHKELNTALKSMSLQTGSLITCTVCGKTNDLKTNSKARQTMQQHIESMHVDGLLYKCAMCDKTFRSKNARYTHKSKHHRQS